MTDSERRLWYHINRRQLDGLHFRRQAPIGRYIVDFVCYEKKLIIEVDGGQHNSEQGIRKDLTRTEWLNSQGFHVLRFWNNDISNNLEGVLTSILSYLDKK